MRAEAACLCPAFVLHRRPYLESSLLIDAFSRDDGRVPLVAKGARNPKAGAAALLRPFVPLRLRYLGNADLKTLVAVEAGAAPSLSAQALHCGFYANELAIRLTKPHDPHPGLFAAYGQCLRQLERHQLAPALRRFELALLAHAGYGLQLTEDGHGQAVADAGRYRFACGQGLLPDPAGPFAGAHLLAMANGDYHLPAVAATAKRLLRLAIDCHLEGRPLKSRAIANQLRKPYEQQPTPHLARR